MKVVELGMVLNDDKSGEGLGRRQGADVQLQCRVTMCHTHKTAVYAPPEQVSREQVPSVLE